MEYAIIAPNHLSDYRSSGSFIHLLNNQIHEDPNGKVVASSDLSSSILILPYKFFDSSQTHKLVMSFLSAMEETHIGSRGEDVIEGQEICIRLEGATLSQQLSFLTTIESSRLADSVMIPPYSSLSDRKALIEAIDKVHIRVLEVPVRCEDHIELFKEEGVLSISTSLPVRLGCMLRDIGEGPEPDSKLEDLDDLQPRWTQRVVENFVRLCK